MSNEAREAAIELALQAAADVHGGYMNPTKTRAVRAAIAAFEAAKPAGEVVGWQPEHIGLDETGHWLVAIYPTEEAASRDLHMQPRRSRPLYTALTASPVPSEPCEPLPEAFITCTSAAPNYYVTIKAKTLKEAQTWHNAVLELVKQRALTRPEPAVKL